jgi:Gpi18-like mannosyltransferase
MLVLLISSSVWTFGLRSREYTRPSYKVNHFKTTDSEVAVAQRSIRLLKSLAVPQLLLALLAITNYHVQIINRIASGYPVWYLWIASALVEETRSQAVSSKTTVNILSQLSKPIVIVQAMVIYGLIQGGLFASFLPPA